jgi:hypothetical protein
MVILVGATCAAAFANKKFRYRGGKLHSESDEPAAEFLPTGCIAVDEPRLQYIVCRAPGEYEAGFWSFRLINNDKLNWYCNGDLHRAYGPAVISYNSQPRDADDFSWAKYHHGVQTASASNTYTGVQRMIPLQLLEYCGAKCRCAIACELASVKMVACEVIMHRARCNGARYGGARDLAQAHVYQTCAGVIIQCEAKTRSADIHYYIVGDRTYRGDFGERRYVAHRL